MYRALARLGASNRVILSSRLFPPLGEEGAGQGWVAGLVLCPGLDWWELTRPELTPRT
jgi:hypothetical protein